MVMKKSKQELDWFN